MALFGFGKKKGSGDSTAGGNGGEGNGADDNGGAGDNNIYKRNPRKADAFFRHAETTADARNYDYAIEMYVNGLKHDIDNVKRYEQLYDVSTRRKVGGGKPAGIKEKMKAKGASGSVEKLMAALKLWALDPINPAPLVDTMEQAVSLEQQTGEDVGLGDVVYWMGGHALQTIKTIKKTDKLLRRMVVCFEQISAFDKAVEAQKLIARNNPEDNQVFTKLKELEAEQTMQTAKYGEAGEGGFRASMRDADKQRAYEQEESISKTEDVKQQIAERRRAEYEENPDDLDRLLKLVEALAALETDEAELEAISLLKKAHEQSGQYRHKMRIGDIKMKQVNRYMRKLRAKMEAHPDNPELRAKYEKIRNDRLIFELKEYEQRVKNYPTDLGLKYQYGRRLHQTGRFDDAIGMFQQATSDPKVRTLSYQFLGDCYIRKDWLDEAIETLNKGFDLHPVKDDRAGLDLNYMRMTAYKTSAEKHKNPEHAREALKIASNILQSNINYRDIRLQVDQLRELAKKLESDG